MLILFEEGMLSTFRTTGIPKQRINEVNRYNVQCFTLDSILEQYNLSSIDVLSVDVEGFEDKVLEGFNINKYNPILCIVELHDGRYDAKSDGILSPYRDEELINKCKKYLINYNLIYSDHINNIYIRKNND